MGTSRLETANDPSSLHYRYPGTQQSGELLIRTLRGNSLRRTCRRAFAERNCVRQCCFSLWREDIGEPALEPKPGETPTAPHPRAAPPTTSLQRKSGSLAGGTQLHLRAALAHRNRLAVLQRIKHGLIKQRPAVADVPGLRPRLRPLARRSNRLGLPGPSDDGGLGELLESSLTRYSSNLSRTRSSALIAWHSGKDCGNCACAKSGDSPVAACFGSEASHGVA